MLKNKFILLILLLFLQARQIFAQSDNSEQKFAVDELQKDFLLLRQVLEEVHPGLHWFTGKQKLNTLFDSTFALIDRKMSEVEFYKMLAPLVAKIHCGHTIIDPSYIYQDNGSRFPLDLKFIDGKAYILYNYSNDKSLNIGSEVLSINGKPMLELIRLFLPNIAGDALHEAGKYQSLEEDFQNYYDILVGRPDTFYLECIDYLSKQKIQISLPAQDSDFLRGYNKRYFEDLKEKMLDFRILEDTKTAVLTIHSFLPIDIKFSKQKYSKFIKACFREIKNKNIEDLIIDLRKNGGGEMLYANELFSNLTDSVYKFLDRVEVTTNKKDYLHKYDELAQSKAHNPRRVSQTDSGTYVVSEKYYTFLNPQLPKKDNFKGNLYLLTSKKTYSAAGLFTALAYHRASIIGEETAAGSGGLNGGDFLDIVLPNTNLLIEIPIEKWVKTIPHYLHPHRGILPHYPVKKSIEDYIKGIDKDLEFALELIKKRRGSQN